MTEPLVLAGDTGPVRCITLNRPERLNAFTEPLHLTLRAALSEAAGRKSIRALVLTGAGRGFCAGQDLTERQTQPGETPRSAAETLGRLWNPLVQQIRSLPFPTIAAVNGVAAGAGCSIAAACDLIVAAESAKFIQAFSKIGLIPDAGGTWTLPRLVGRQRAFGLAATAEPLSASQAAQWGMVWKVAPDQHLMDEALALAAQLAALPNGAMLELRAALDASETNSLAAQLEHERAAQGKLSLSADCAEGVRAFLEKRPAKFGERE